MEVGKCEIRVKLKPSLPGCLGLHGGETSGRLDVYSAGQNDYLPVFFFEGLITEFGNKLPDLFFP